MKIFAGTYNAALSQSIAKALDLELGKVEIKRFSDGEISITIRENVRGNNVYVVQPTVPPAENFLELAMMVDALRRASAGSICAVIPYYGYARQDRRPRSMRMPIGAKVVADILEAVGVTHIITVDIHAEQIQGFFRIPMDNAYATKVMVDDIVERKLNEKAIVVSPDIGGVARARAFAKRLGDLDLAIVDKRRPKDNEAEALTVIGNVQDKISIVVDDMVDTAGTLSQCANLLRKEGAAKVVAYCTHPVLSGKAIANIETSEIEEVVVTDTIVLSEEAAKSKKIRVLSMAGTLAEAIRRADKADSITELFAT